MFYAPQHTQNAHIYEANQMVVPKHTIVSLGIRTNITDIRSGIDERPNITEPDLYNISKHLEKKRLLDILMSTVISDADKQRHIENSGHIFEENASSYSVNLLAGGLLSDW